MKKHNQKGFTIVEILLALFVAVAIGFGGYWVWHSQKSKDKALEATSSADGMVNIDAQNQYKGWQAFKAPAEGFTLKYPADWKVVKGLNTESYDITAPDGLIVRYVYLDTLDSDLGSCGHQSFCPTQRIISIDDLSLTNHSNIQLIRTLPDEYDDCYGLYLNDADSGRKPKVGDNKYDDSYFFYSLKSKNGFRYTVFVTNSLAGNTTFKCDGLSQAQFFRVESVKQAELILRSITF